MTGPKAFIWGALGILFVTLAAAPNAAAQQESEASQAERAAKLKRAKAAVGIYAIHAAVDDPAFTCFVRLTATESSNRHGDFFAASVVDRPQNDVHCSTMGFKRPVTHWSNHWHGQIWLMPGQDEWRMIFFPEPRKKGVYRAPGGYYFGRPQGPIDLLMRKLSDEEIEALD